MEPVRFTPVYAITDYKCQRQAYDYLVADLKKPLTGTAPTVSAYVQLSRGPLPRTPVYHAPFRHERPPDNALGALAAEREWQRRMAAETI